MATRFELVLHGKNESALRAAGEEALDEIDRLESQLSLYRPGTEMAQVNARAAREAVRVTPEVFRLLQHAKELSGETSGAFDITVGPLVRCWGFMDGRGKHPSADELAAARAVVGINHVQLNEQNLTVRFARDGVMIDLGAIGKGYAVERAANMLRESGVISGLIHGGTSTVHGIGHPPDRECWKVAIEVPKTEGHHAREGATNPRSSSFKETRRPATVATVLLMDESLSVSAVWGRYFEMDRKQLGHVIDPRSGRPVHDALLAAVVLPSATETDAFSTALLTCGRTGLDQISLLRPGMRTLLVEKEAGELRFDGRGILAGGNLAVEKQTRCD